MYFENIYMYLHVYIYIHLIYVLYIYIYMCVYLYIHNKYTQYTGIYYVNKNYYFGCNYSFDSTNIYQIRPIKNSIKTQLKQLYLPPSATLFLWSACTGLWDITAVKDICAVI